MPPPPSPIAVWSSGHHREPLPFLPYNTINSPPTSAHADPTPSFPFLSFPLLSFHSLPSSIDIDISSSLCSKPLLQTSTSPPLFASTALKQFFTVTAFSNSAGEKKKKTTTQRKTGRTGQKRHSREKKREREISEKEKERSERENRGVCKSTKSQRWGKKN